MDDKLGLAPVSILPQQS